MRPPEDLRAARVTLAVAIVTVAAWLVAQLGGWQDVAIVAGGFIPARVAGLEGDILPVPVWLTPLTATLVHSGFLHLFFNLLMLLICGRALEPVIGGRGVAILYLAGAFAAAAAQYPVDPESTVPMVGASGAVSAVLGAYALTFSRNKVKVADPRLAALLHALWLGAAWIVFQLLIGFTYRTGGLRIAIAAHIGGFLAGLILARPLLLLKWRGA